MISLFLFIFGCCVGSFLNVCIYRQPKEVSIVKPSSFCPHCRTPIKWYDNIPLISYLILRGKCRTCQAKISLRYPFVELVTGLLFLFLYQRYGPSISFVKFAFFFSLLIVMSFIDIDYHAIPMSLSVIGITGGLTLSIYDTLKVMGGGGFTEAVALPAVNSFIGLIVGCGFAYVFKFFGDTALRIYLSWKKKESIEGETESLGIGDVDFLGMVGVFLGWKLAVLTFFIAPFLGLGYSVLAILFKRSHVIPYLPYLSGGAFIAFLWGSTILKLFYL